MRYILNSAVITSPGLYKYDHITLDEMITWLNKGKFISTIRYEETANALSQITEINIPIRDENIKMAPGDEALVFRLSLPKGIHGIGKQDKGSLGIDFILRHSEKGILKRVE